MQFQEISENVIRW